MAKQFYKDFQSIEIPSFLLDWRDDSWGNDVTASSRKELSDKADLVVWVNPDKVEEREMWEDFKYVVILEDKARNEIQGREVNTEAEALEAIRKLKEYHDEYA